MYSREATFIGISDSTPSRFTVSLISFPAKVPNGASNGEPPFIFVMTSPTFNPAFAAEPPVSTPLMAKPPFRGRTEKPKSGVASVFLMSVNPA